VPTADPDDGQQLRIVHDDRVDHSGEAPHDSSSGPPCPKTPATGRSGNDDSLQPGRIGTTTLTWIGSDEGDRVTRLEERPDLAVHDAGIIAPMCAGHHEDVHG
jgi:hypothetical protein